MFEQIADVKYSGLKPWLDEEVISKISKSNNDPEWMLSLRLKAFEDFKNKPMPKWGPNLWKLNLDDIYYFAKPEWSVKNADSWEKVPKNIKDTFDRLWIPEAEKEMLAWVWAQFDSEVVYHSMKQELIDKWVIFEDMSVACKKHPDLLKKYFMKAVPANDHKFSLLHAAVWSSGTFLYIPKWVKLDEPLQSYFRMNVKAWWQFEHTIIIVDDWAEAHYIEWCSAPKYWSASLHAWCVELYIWKWSKLRYSSVENWSADTYNLNTKRAIVEEDWHIEWVWGNLWAWVTMLYPCSVLKWDRSTSSHVWVAFANSWQIIDAWAKVIHIWKNTTSKVVSKSLSAWWWSSIYRWYLDIKSTAENAVANISCDWLILDELSSSITIPYMKTDRWDSLIAHEASAWKINEGLLFFMESRWIWRKQAEIMIVNGFLSPVMDELPLEYASEMNTIISMELEGAF